MDRELLGPGGPFELTAEDGPGSGRRVFKHRPKSVVDVLTAGADRLPGRPYLVFPDRTLTFDSVVGVAARVA
ncbi:MAG: class I adenylate-forming enzyme family protein, partial [Acidimicrobiales bacterium]